MVGESGMGATRRAAPTCARARGAERGARLLAAAAIGLLALPGRALPAEPAPRPASGSEGILRPRAAARGDATPAALEALVEVEVLGVLPVEEERASLLLLRQKGGARVLPIFVGRAEGTAIERRLAGRAAAHPRAGELLERSLEALGARVLRVEIASAHAALFRARVAIEQGERRAVVEARPSEAVALAVAAGAPLFATRAVIDEAGLTREDLDRLQRARDDGAPRARTGAGKVLRF